MYILALSGSFSSPFIGASPRFIARKCATLRKKCELWHKSPRKKKKNGELFGKNCAPVHTARLSAFGTPLPRPHPLRFLRPVRTSARSLRTSTCRCGRCFPSRHTLATRNAPAAHTGKDVRLELHAPMPEDIPFTDANSGRTQRMIEKQTRKCHKKRTRARVRRF